MTKKTNNDGSESFYSKHSDSIRMMLSVTSAIAVTASVVYYTGLIVALAPLSATMGLLGPVALGLICLTSVALLSKAFDMLIKETQHKVEETQHKVEETQPKVEADIDNSKSPAEDYMQANGEVDELGLPRNLPHPDL
jgi:hypothetical protein